MVSHRISSILAMLAVAGLVACGGGSTSISPGDDTGSVDADASQDDSMVPPGLAVETDADPTTQGAGEPIAVTCTVTVDGEPIEAVTDVAVEGTVAFTYQDGELKITETGVFQIACVDTKTGVQDETPVTVTIIPGTPVTIETEVSKNEAVAGEEVVVTCTLWDAYGNVSDKHCSVAVDPTDGWTLSDDLFVADKAGSYDLACSFGGGTLLDATPETVVVGPNALNKVVTNLADESIPAGSQTTVACTAFDAYGNEIPNLQYTIDTPEEVQLSGTTLTGTVAGTYEITCLPSDGLDVSLESDMLTIEPLDPVGLELKLVPSKPSYSIGDQVKVGFTLVDKYDNPVPGGEIEDPTAEPETGLEKVSGKTFKFLEEGLYLFSSCLVGDSQQCDDIEAWCDGTGPLLVIDYPERGASLSGSTTVVVTGSVNESTSELVSLTINGDTVSVNEDGTFAYSMAAKQALNVIDAAAIDTFDNETRTIRSFLFSNQYNYTDAASPAQSLIDLAIRAYLDDNLFYGDSPEDEGNLSFLVSSIMGDLDIGAMIPNPVVEDQDLSVLCLWDTYTIFIENVTYGEATVQLAPTPGGVKLVVNIPDFHAEFAAETDGFACLDYSGLITADSVSLVAVILISVDETTGEFGVAVSNVIVEFNGLNIELGGIVGWLVNWLIDLLEGTVASLLEDQFATLITQTVDDLMGGIIDDLGAPFEIPIDPLFPGMNQVVLYLSLDPQTADFDQGGGEVGIGMSISSQKMVDKDTPGALGRSACLADTPEQFVFNQAEAEKIELAAHVDLVNQGLFAFWYNGGLNLSITAEALAEMGVDLSGYGIADLNATTDPLLPPVFTTCNPEEEFTIQMGDFYMEADFVMLGKPVDVHMYLFLEMTAALEVIDGEAGKEVGIVINDPNFVEVEIAYLNDEWKGNEGTFTGLIKNTLVPMLLKQVQETPLSFAVPAINLADLAGSSEGTGDPPALQLPDKELLLDLKEIGHSLGYLLIRTGIIIQDPPPPEDEGE